MKRFLMVLIGTLLFYVPLSAQYYYYKGQKIPIVINKDSVVVYTAHTSNNKIFDIKASTIAIDATNEIIASDPRSIVAFGHIIGDSITNKMSNSFYIKLYKNTDTIILKELVEKTNTHLIGKVPYMENWYKILVANSTINNTLEMSNYFYESGLFADVDPGFNFDFTTTCVSDAMYSDQWALPSINACDAWEYTKGNPNIRVAIVDEGIDMSHQEFTNSFFYEPSYDCDLDLEVNNFYGSHGTNVVGVISSNHNYGEMAGIAPNVTIMPISYPFINRAENAPERLASGISWAVRNGADIINCSWGGGRGGYNNDYTALLEDAILNAIEKGRNNKGCILVFASGNSATSTSTEPILYPGCFTPEILVVGSHTLNNKRSYFSCYGAELDVVAPGTAIYTIDTDNYYNTVSGTSFAAPYVSGVAALVLSVNPDLTREEVVNIIEVTSKKHGGYVYLPTDNRHNGTWNDSVGYGLVDAYAAVLAAQPKHIQNQTYQSGKEVYEYATEITAGYAVTDNKPYGNVILEAGSDVTLRAMEQVVLKPGFHAKAGSKLHIKVDSPTTTQSASSPQQLAPRTSSAPTDNKDATMEEVINTVESVSVFAPSAQKIIFNGQLLIIHDGKMYNVMGVEVGE